MQISTTKKLVSIGSRFAYGTVDMTPDGTDIWMGRGKNQLEGWEIRELPDTQAIAAVDETDKTARKLTVSDGTKFRLEEILQVTDAGGNDQGAIRVVAINGNVITFTVVQGPGTTHFLPVVGGSVEYEADEKVKANQTKTLNTNTYPFVLMKAVVDTGADNLSVATTSDTTPTQKKN